MNRAHKLLFALLILVFVSASAVILLLGMKKVRNEVRDVQARIESIDKRSASVDRGFRYLIIESENMPISKVQGSSSAFDKGEWHRIAGRGELGSWDAEKFGKVRSLEEHNGLLFAGLFGGVDEPDPGQVWKFDGRKWSRSSNDLRRNHSTEGGVNVLLSHRGSLYAGTFLRAQLFVLEAEEWREVPTPFYEKYDAIYSMATWNGNLVVGLMSTAGDAAVYELRGEEWRKIGGDGIRGSWEYSTNIYELWSHHGKLYASLQDVSTGIVYSYDGDGWEIAAGRGVNNSQRHPEIVAVAAMGSYRGNLITTTWPNPYGSMASPVFAFDGASWSRVGKNAPAEWQHVHLFNHTIAYQGNLIVGGGGIVPGHASVWEFQGDGWSRVGGNGLLGSWSKNGHPIGNGGAEYVYRMEQYGDNLVVGFGYSKGVAELWMFSPEGAK